MSCQGNVPDISKKTESVTSRILGDSHSSEQMSGIIDYTYDIAGYIIVYATIQYNIHIVISLLSYQNEDTQSSKNFRSTAWKIIDMIIMFLYKAGFILLVMEQFYRIYLGYGLITSRICCIYIHDW